MCDFVLHLKMYMKKYLNFFYLKQTEYGKYFYICDVVMYGHI